VSGRWTIGLLVALLATGCSWLFGEHVPPSQTSTEVKRVSFQIVARGGRCEPAVLAADREGGPLLIVFDVTSVGGDHFFLVPDVGIRKLVPAGTRLEIPYLAQRSGVFEIACTSARLITPFTRTGKLAIK
jgi:hypothetical protein